MERSWPKELFYHRDHCWVKVENNNQVIIGLDEFFIKKAGEINKVKLPFEGDEIKVNESFGEVLTVSGDIKVVAPLSGEIMEVNLNLEDDPQVLMKDPYQEGWMMKVIASNLEDEIEMLIKGKSS
ncbi:glycine cleavage system protein H [bacterium]|nr:glycine cleavage system protein H [bacterium]MBU1153117.1 glycine cleavage system protein H [bacterium]MBU1782650.1 glycine cleavage system protein H [bacterium]MBU2599220.1 glycine cleavage system protein H [bacterium]